MKPELRMAINGISGPPMDEEATYHISSGVTVCQTSYLPIGSPKFGFQGTARRLIR